VAFDQSDHTTAGALYRESLALHQQLENKHGVAMLLESFIGLAVALAQFELALQLAGAATTLRKALNTPPPPDKQATLERQLSQARQALGTELVDAALAVGQSLPLEQAGESIHQLIAQAS
jgi:hypothetical protein